MSHNLEYYKDKFKVSWWSQ